MLWTWSANKMFDWCVLFTKIDEKLWLPTNYFIYQMAHLKHCALWCNCTVRICIIKSSNSSRKHLLPEATNSSEMHYPKGIDKQFDNQIKNWKALCSHSVQRWMVCTCWLARKWQLKHLLYQWCCMKSESVCVCVLWSFNHYTFHYHCTTVTKILISDWLVGVFGQHMFYINALHPPGSWCSNIKRCPHQSILN